MTTTHEIPATRNEAWGFWGTMEGHAQAAWPLAMNAIAEATGEPFEAVRAFLDSRFGRHFADEVHNALDRGHALPEAIAATTRKWMGRTIGPRNGRDYGIPSHLPYLTGFVIHCGIVEESLAT
jgi:hypothetical protein